MDEQDGRQTTATAASPPQCAYRAKMVGQGPAINRPTATSGASSSSPNPNYTKTWWYQMPLKARSAPDFSALGRTLVTGQSPVWPS